MQRVVKAVGRHHVRDRLPVDGAGETPAEVAEVMKLVQPDLAPVVLGVMMDLGMQQVMEDPVGGPGDADLPIAIAGRERYRPRPHPGRRQDIGRVDEFRMQINGASGAVACEFGDRVMTWRKAGQDLVPEGAQDPRRPGAFPGRHEDVDVPHHAGVGGRGASLEQRGGALQEHDFEPGLAESVGDFQALAAKARVASRVERMERFKIRSNVSGQDVRPPYGRELPEQGGGQQMLVGQREDPHPVQAGKFLPVRQARVLQKSGQFRQGRRPPYASRKLSNLTASVNDDTRSE